MNMMTMTVFVLAENMRLMKMAFAQKTVIMRILDFGLVRNARINVKMLKCVRIVMMMTVFVSQMKMVM